jgi:hypothetical protein
MSGTPDYVIMPVQLQNEHAPLCVCGALDGHYKGVEARHCLTRMLGHQTQKRVSLSGIDLVMKRSNPVLDW